METMEINDEQIRQAVKNTEILRLPKRSLATFGTTNLNYYLVTEPSYSELVSDDVETVIREGRVIAERPKIVTPYYLSRLEGFGPEARRYFDILLKTHDPNTPGLFYTYKNESKGLNIVSESLTAVVDKLNAEIDQRNDPLASIIKGEDLLWDVSILRFIYEITRSSLGDNVTQMSRRGLLDRDISGVPVAAKMKIEELFRQTIKGDRDPSELKRELDRWNLFKEYEDQFYNIFKR